MITLRYHIPEVIRLLLSFPNNGNTTLMVNVSREEWKKQQQEHEKAHESHSTPPPSLLPEGALIIEVGTEGWPGCYNNQAMQRSREEPVHKQDYLKHRIKTA